MFRLCYFTPKTKRFVSVPEDNISMVDLAWYPAGEDTAMDEDTLGFANLELRFKDQKRLIAKWEVTQNQFFKQILQPLKDRKGVARPADFLRLRKGDRDPVGFTYISRDSFWTLPGDEEPYPET